MDPTEVEKLIKAGLPDCEVSVKGDGSHFDAVVVGEVFADLSAVKQQQLVYATVVDKITNSAPVLDSELPSRPLDQNLYPARMGKGQETASFTLNTASEARNLWTD